MSIADKLTTIAENQHRIYQAGYDKGKADILETVSGNNICNIADFTYGYIANDSGAIASSSTLMYSKPIYVSKGDVIRNYIRIDGSEFTKKHMRFVTAYKEDGTLLPNDGAANTGEYAVPSELVSYVIITIHISNSYEYEITKNYEATSYEEYEERTVIKQSLLPKASQNSFGVAKIWTTVVDGETVLNISTEE